MVIPRKETTKFLLDLQRAREITKKSNTMYFGREDDTTN